MMRKFIEVEEEIIDVERTSAILIKEKNGEAVEVVVERVIRTENSTISNVHLNGEFVCYALEDVDRGLKSSMPLSEIKKRKLKTVTCIPEGRYECRITFSAHFKKWLPQLMNVPGYEGIRIHPGNVPADSHGCILPGMSKTIDKVTESTAAFTLLYHKIKTAVDEGKKVWVTIE